MNRVLALLVGLVAGIQYTTAQAQGGKAGKIIVSQDGKGDFNSIQAAINSLPENASYPRMIYVKNGTYKEKIYIQKHNIVIEGEDKEKVILTQAVARDEWRCLHNDDWGVATLNLEGNDITLQNLTITNSYGFDQTEEVTISCLLDTVTGQKKIQKAGHQMALRTFRCTRLKVINCILRAFGGDTVSPWNVEEGMYYFKECVMEGGVDFYCPRGWAYAENCTFIAHSGVASIWHDGSRHEDSKTVLKNCSFKGFDGFYLGRYHRDAQFYLIDCSFAENMADKDIFLVPTTNIIRWGRRIFYYNCHRKGKDFSWYADNITATAAAEISAAWVFGNRWKL